VQWTAFLTWSNPNLALIEWGLRAFATIGSDCPENSEKALTTFSALISRTIEGPLENSSISESSSRIFSLLGA